MAGHYPKRQELVPVRTTLTSNILLHPKKKGSLHSVTTDEET